MDRNAAQANRAPESLRGRRAVLESASSVRRRGENGLREYIRSARRRQRRHSSGGRMACLARIAGTFACRAPRDPVSWPAIFQRANQTGARQLQGYLSLVQFRGSEGRRSVEFIAGGENRRVVSRRRRIRTARARQSQLAGITLGAVRGR